MSSLNKQLKILQICPRVPFPPTDGGAIAMFDVAKGLSKAGHDVTILAINTPKHFQKEDVLNDFAKLITVFVNTNLSIWKAFFNLFSKIPYNISRFMSYDVSLKIIELLKQENYDVIQFEGTFVAFYIDLVKEKSYARTVLRVHNLEYRIWKRLAKNTKNPLKKIFFHHLSKGVNWFEKEQFPKFDALASISELETVQMLKEKYNSNIKTIPAGVDLERFQKLNIEKEENSIFIISSLNWEPNIEAVLWFLKEVMPSLVIKNPTIKLHIAGKNPTKEIRSYASENVVIHGFVESASEFMQQYNLMLVPLLSGGGMRIKIIEGMAMEKGIVSSTIGAEGIRYENNKDITICNEPEEWVNAILRLLKDENRLQNIEQNAYQTVLKYYENSSVIKMFEKIYGV